MPFTPLPANRLYLASTLSEPAFGPTADSLFYVRMADGRRSIMRQSTSTGLAQAVTAEPLPAGGVGYGGAIYAVRGSLLVYAAGGSLQAVDLGTGRQWAVTPSYEGVAAPTISPGGRFVAFLCEQTGHCNVLLADVEAKALPVKLSADPWYAFNPVFSPDGARLAWVEWNANDMPWDESRLVIARLARPTDECQAAHQALPLETSTLARARVSYGGPQFSPDGQRLLFTSDESGWRSLWVAQADGGQAARVDTGPGEIGGPDWTPGSFRARWSGDGTGIYAVRRHESRDSLLRIAWPGRLVTELETEWTLITGLNVGGGEVTFVGANPSTPETLVTFDLQRRASTPRATSAVGLLDPGSLAQPRVISWSTVGGGISWGVFLPAAGPQTGPRPLLVIVHGGPTSERPLGWDPLGQYFATRGWHCLWVNHRGGTGFGRAYQDLLNGAWGVVDVQDARSGAEHLVAEGLADPLRLVIHGGSAGGYTTLMALTRDPEFWAAGVSLYGVGGLYDLKQGSHRFEVNYEHGLVGPLPESGPRWVERSPLTHVKNVHAPVLLFHGTQDKAVPHQQSVDFAEAVRRQGGTAELVSYEGEGHGFVREANRRDQLERMERFLEKYVLCLQR